MLPEPRRSMALSTRGFMPEVEGDALWRAGMEAATALPGLALLELGSYCGRSTVWLGDVAERCNTVLFALDHHRGSEENQAGWEHHDAEVVDERIAKMDTLPFFRATVHDAELEDSVAALVGQSAAIGAAWSTPLALLFIDGGHGVEPARSDYRLWTPHVAKGGTLAIHDVFENPADGGRPPYEEIYLPALASGRFVERSVTGSLRVLTCVG